MNKPFWPRTLHLHAAHLHARDSYVESLLATRLTARLPEPHGILDIDVDETAAASGVVALRRVSAIFPSGAVVRSEAGASLRREVPVPGGEVALDVFLGLPRLLARGPNVSFEGGPSRSTRFVAVARRDANDLPAMRPNPEIVLEGERLDGFECLRLGRLRGFGKALRFERNALPTALRVRGSSALSEGLARLIQGVAARRAELVQYRADHPLSLRGIVASELPALQLSVILQRHLPVLSDVAARRSAHPHELYVALASLHGALAAFSHPEVAPPYDHEEQGSSFPWLLARITRLVDEAARDALTVLAFRRVDDSTFRLSFERQDLTGKRPLLVLRGADETFLRDRVPSLLKMASPTAIQPLLHSSLRGVSVAVEFEPPPVVPRQEGVVAYRIDVRDRLWLDIEDRSEIQLQLVGAPPALQAALYAVERPA